MKLVRTVNAVGDRLLGKLLPQSIAGACVPEHGQTYEKTRCFNGIFQVRTCTITCTGASECGSWRNTEYNC